MTMHNQNSVAFRVIFTAKLRPEANRHSALNTLNKVFKLKKSQIQALLKCAPTPIKKSLTEDQATKLSEALWKAGWLCEVEEYENAPHLDVNEGEAQKTLKPNLRTIDSDPEKKLKRIVSENNDCSICVPVAWETMSNLNLNACIQSGSKASECYLIVIRQAKSELGDDISLERYASAVTHTGAKGIQDGIVVNEPKLKAIRGTKYAVSEMRGIVATTQVYYSIAIYENDIFFYTLYFWCSVASYPQRKASFELLAGSFHLQ